MSSSSKWFYTHNGKDKPRVTLSQLIELFNSGTISKKTYVWHKQYCKNWTPINKVSIIIDQINQNQNQIKKHRKQPSIIRSNNNSNNDNISISNTSNNTSSDIEEIIINDIEDINNNTNTNSNSNTNNNNNKKIVPPHIIDTPHMITYYSNSNDEFNNSDEVINKYKINQLVEINDPSKPGICYGIIIDIRHSKIIIKYNNKIYGTEWFDINDNRIIPVTDSNSNNNSNSNREMEEFEYDNLINLEQQKKLLNLERNELKRDQQKFYYDKKKHETELWVVKNDYTQSTKRLKKQYNIYKQTCDKLLNNNIINSDIIKYYKLEMREKLIRDQQKTIDKKEKTAQILYQTSTHLLQKIQNANMKLQIYSKLCDEKCEIEKELINKQEMDRKKYLNKMNKLRNEMLSAPWLLLKDVNFDINNVSNDELQSLYKQLNKTYRSIREERRKFLPIQRKWSKLITKHQIVLYEEKALNNIRLKLENIRKYEKEYKLKLLKEPNISIQKLKEQEIIIEFKQQLLNDKEMQITNEKKLLNLKEKHLEESIMELEYERELILAQQYNNKQLKQQLNEYSQINKMNSINNNNKFTLAITTLQEELKEKYEIIQMHEIEKKKNQILIEQVQNKNELLNKENTELKNIIFELKQKNKELIKRNQDLEYEIPHLSNENQILREQIKEMIIISTETNDSSIENNIDIPPINDEKEVEHVSDNTLNNIRTKLANSDENGRLITKHESQNSMTAIVALVKKTKTNRENIENISGNISDISDDENNNNNIFLSTPNNSDDDNNSDSDKNISSDEPPIFWNNDNDIQNDRSILQRMISNPNEVLNNVISPNEKNNINTMFENSLSDWDKNTNTSNSNSNYSNNENENNENNEKNKNKNKKQKKQKKQIKKKRKKSIQTNIHNSDKKYNKKRRSKKLNTNELLFQNE